jgi:hypothetical protein
MVDHQSISTSIISQFHAGQFENFDLIRTASSKITGTRGELETTPTFVFLSSERS